MGTPDRKGKVGGGYPIAQPPKCTRTAREEAATGFSWVDLRCIRDGNGDAKLAALDGQRETGAAFEHHEDLAIRIFLRTDRDKPDGVHKMRPVRKGAGVTIRGAWGTRH